jgi:glycosyltransferase involved in cell wall biosynthesis
MTQLPDHNLSAPSPSDTPLRVAYVMTHYPKLAQTFIANEIEGVRAQGISVQCFAMNPAEAAELAHPGAAEQAAGTIYLKPAFAAGLLVLAGQSLRHPIAIARVWAKAVRSGGGQPKRVARRLAHLVQAALVAQTAKEQGITRLHAHFGLAPATIVWLASAIAAAHGRNLPFSFTIHGYHDFVDAAESRLDLKLRDAASVLCISDFTRAQLCLITPPQYWAKAQVARCGVDLDALAFRPPAPLVAGKVPVVMALGRLSPEKGFPILIDALAKLAADGLPMAARLVGDGPMRAELEAKVKAAGLADRVHFVGEVPPDAVRAELAGADIFCMASFSEGLPVSIMEAMAAGVPVVTTWIAGIPELAENDVTALTIPPARVDALAAALRRLASEPELGPRLANAARTRVAALHDKKMCAAVVANALREDR